ncbi:MAG: 2-oxoacid:ferredoxin oxidoreductase subunit beta [Candidatus Aminicenantales bacterium]
MRTSGDYHLTDPSWCPGCGIYAVFSALKKCAAELNLSPEEIVVVTGIGCHGRLSNYFYAYGFHGLHGRVLPVASGIKLANPALSVIGVSGDGDAYSIGLSHLVHALRRNVSLLYIVVDNRLFALTQGQTSPTSRIGFVSRSTPYGAKERPLDGIKIALAAGGTFIARGFSGEPSHLVKLFLRALKHRGFAFVEVLSPCVTQNRMDTYKWFKNHILRIDAEPGFDASDRDKAWEKLGSGEKIPIGLFYEEERPSFEEIVLPDLKKPIASHRLEISERKFEKLLKEFE